MPKRRRAASDELVPVVVQRGVDVDRDAHREAVDTVARDVASARAQIAAVVRNGVAAPGRRRDLRRRRRRGLADVDWPALQRPLELHGRRVNVVDTRSGGGGDGAAAAVPPRLGVELADLAAQHRGVHGHAPLRGARPAGLRRTPRCRPSRSRSRATRRRVDAMCDALGIEPSAVVGNSMGGFVGAELALSFPTRVERLVLVSAAGLSTEYLRARAVARDRPRARGRRCQHATRLERRVVRRPRLRRRGDAVRWSATPSGCRVPLAQELVLERRQAGLRAGAQGAARATRTASGSPQIEIPVLIVWGRNDMLVPVGDAERYERLIGDNARVRSSRTPATCRCSSGRRASTSCCARSWPATREPEAEIAGRPTPAGGQRLRRVTAPSEALDTSLRVLGQHAVGVGRRRRARRPRRGAAISSSESSTSMPPARRRRS